MRWVVAPLLGQFFLAVPSYAEVDPILHEKCSSASDYAGCVKANTVGVADRDQEECISANGNTTCVAKPGIDRLGLPKKAGWKYFVDNKGNIHYIEITGERFSDGDWLSNWYQVPHKGQERYVARRRVVSTTYSGKSGTPGRIQSFGGSRTTCNTYSPYGSGMTTCYTSPPVQTYIPGTAGTPGGVEQLSFIEVQDCKDRTVALYRDGKLFQGGWVKMSGEPSPACSRMTTLPVMDMDL